MSHSLTQIDGAHTLITQNFGNILNAKLSFHDSNSKFWVLSYGNTTQKLNQTTTF